MPSATTNRRRCIFCGNTPESKTLEHILPLWLIKHTGDPKRIVYHGMHFGNGPTEMRPKFFSFDQFRFPACDACNQRWSDLEQNVKSTLQLIEAEEVVTELQLNDMLDWFDKIRVGIWLSRHIDRSSIAEVDPKFYIDQRVGASDRLLFISRGADVKALTTIGVGGAVFGFMPSVFAMRINGLMFFNASSVGLFGHRLGFPRLRDKKIRVGGQTRYSFEIEPGTHKISKPIVHQKYPLPALKIYQPMYRYLQTHSQYQEYFRSDYVLENSLDWSLGEGAIFSEQEGEVARLSFLDKHHFPKGYIDNGNGLLTKVDRAVSNWQRQLSISGVRGDIGTPERKNQYNTTLARARRIDSIFSKVTNSKR